MRNRRWNGALLLILCAMLLSACTKQPAASERGGPEAAGQTEAAAAPIALTVSSDRYRAEYFSSDRLAIVSAAAADDGAVYLWGRNFQNEVESNWLIRYNADPTPTAASSTTATVSASGR